MAADIISAYAGYYLILFETAINAQLDLCEDDNPEIRIKAIKNLPQFSKVDTKYAVRITDVLIPKNWKWSSNLC